jgi:hypothetical protein
MVGKNRPERSEQLGSVSIARRQGHAAKQLVRLSDPWTGRIVYIHVGQNVNSRGELDRADLVAVTAEDERLIETCDE